MQSTYCTAKHASHGWTDALRMELEMEKAPVAVTLIHPGRIDTPYNEHAQSYYQHQVAHRGMVYPPQAVAEAILYSAAHPKRDMYVGVQAKVLKMLGDRAPRFMGKLMEVVTDPGQVDPARPSINLITSALYKAGYGLKENGSHEGWFRSGSYARCRAPTQPASPGFGPGCEPALARCPAAPAGRALPTAWPACSPRIACHAARAPGCGWGLWGSGCCPPAS